MKRLTEQLESEGDQPDLTPMIDCVFLLLLFFVVTAVFAEESNLFKVELPKAARAEVRQPKDVVVVLISREGAYSVKDSLVPEEQLWARLSEMHSQLPIKTLIIKGDRLSPYEKAIAAMDVAHSLNIGEVTMAVARN